MTSCTWHFVHFLPPTESFITKTKTKTSICSCLPHCLWKWFKTTLTTITTNNNKNNNNNGNVFQCRLNSLIYSHQNYHWVKKIMLFYVLLCLHWTFYFYFSSLPYITFIYGSLPGTLQILHHSTDMRMLNRTFIFCFWSNASTKQSVISNNEFPRDMRIPVVNGEYEQFASIASLRLAVLQVSCLILNFWTFTFCCTSLYVLFFALWVWNCWVDYSLFYACISVYLKG